MEVYEAIKSILEAFQIPVMKFQNSHAPSNGIIQYTDFKPHYLWHESSFRDKVYRNGYSSHCRILYLVLMWFYSKLSCQKMNIRTWQVEPTVFWKLK
jgi:hypothetical protein